jgi:hypothetical protein
VPYVADLFPAWFMSELLRVCLVFKIVLMLHRFPIRLNLNTLHIWDIHRAQSLLLFIQTTANLGINNRVNETLGITSQAADFFNHILYILAYGGSCIVKTLHQPSSHAADCLQLKLRYRPVWVGFL